VKHRQCKAFAGYASWAFATSVTVTCTAGAGLDGIVFAVLNWSPVTSSTAGGVPPATRVQLPEPLNHSQPGRRREERRKHNNSFQVELNESRLPSGQVCRLSLPSA